MIVNADDFGFNERRNDAVAQAFREGLISSATLMTTRDAFRGAAELVRSERLERRVGLHLVLTEDVPVTDPCRRCLAVCDREGRFLPELDSRRLARLGASGRRVVYAEWRAQAEQLRRERVIATHIDSHHHSHTHPLLIGIAIALARELEVGAVRLARNCDARTRAPRRAAHAHVNRRVARAGLATTRWFGRPEDFLELRRRGVGDADDIEVMVHPDLLDGVLVDTSGVPLREVVASLAGPTPPVSYAGVPALTDA